MLVSTHWTWVLQTIKCLKFRIKVQREQKKIHIVYWERVLAFNGITELVIWVDKLFHCLTAEGYRKSFYSNHKNREVICISVQQVVWLIVAPRLEQVTLTMDRAITLLEQAFTLRVSRVEDPQHVYYTMFPYHNAVVPTVQLVVVPYPTWLMFFEVYGSHTVVTYSTTSAWYGFFSDLNWFCSEIPSTEP